MKQKILAIDDSKAIRFLLQTVLGSEYQVITAPDGCSAMYWLSKKNIPDVIIADPQLPDMENWELIEQLTTSGIYRDIPLLVLSSLPEEETVNRCTEMNIQAYYIKPFNPMDLVKTVNRLAREKSGADAQ